MAARGLLLLAPIALSACGSDGYTPACPELPRYDIRKASDRSSPGVVAARRDAIEAGCLTAPASVPPPANAAGSGGTATDVGTDPEAGAGDGGAALAP